jgi:hypothetical protein
VHDIENTAFVAHGAYALMESPGWAGLGTADGGGPGSRRRRRRGRVRAEIDEKRTEAGGGIKGGRVGVRGEEEED